MLPYHWLQAGYAALSLALASLLWLLGGRLLGHARPVLRAGLALAALAALALLATGAMQRAHTPFSSRFVVVALVFYAAAFWLPALLLCAVLARDTGARIAKGAAVLLCLGAPAVALYAMLVEPNRLQVREERVPIARWPAGSRPVRVAHLSDLQTVGPCAREARALEIVRSLAPDLIVVTGDYVAGPFFDTAPAEAAARDFLAGLSAIAPTLAVAGHSEGESVRERVFRGLGVDYLLDRAEGFQVGEGRELRVVGLDPFKPWIDLVFEPRDEHEALLVATHSPDMTVRFDGADVDLHLAGHTHGGQIAIPGFGAPVTLTRLPREYARGLFQVGDHRMNVCAGLGMEGNHAPRVRLFCPPEICLLVLEGSGPPGDPGSAGATR